MPREIMFRGKRVDNGEWWVYGHLLNAPLTIENFGAGHLATPNGERITCIESDGVLFQVTPESVGQFTGLHDKNGKEIYEGDVVRVHNYTATWKHEEPPIDWKVFQVRWNRYLWSLRNEYVSTPLADYDTGTLEPWDIEVIGNIHDNPDLCK